MSSTPFAPMERTVVVGVPLVLGVLEIWHPALRPRDNICSTLEPIAVWWTVLHVLQIPLFALLGVASYLLLRPFCGRVGRLGRIASLVFAVVYPAFDAAVGVASGVMLQTLGSLSQDQRAVLEASLQALFWGSVTLPIAAIGATSWLVALFCMAYLWRKQGAPMFVALAFGASGILLAIAHVRPFGPLACLTLLTAVIWVLRRAPAFPGASSAA
ncbi:MAG TPA: hypothetical protein VFU71_23905 [Burkholderiaceae bacterium]|nr:hypothetical protein [Burkholderiaceae bacterium]